MAAVSHGGGEDALLCSQAPGHGVRRLQPARGAARTHPMQACACLGARRPRRVAGGKLRSGRRLRCARSFWLAGRHAQAWLRQFHEQRLPAPPCTMQPSARSVASCKRNATHEHSSSAQLTEERWSGGVREGPQGGDPPAASLAAASAPALHLGLARTAAALALPPPRRAPRTAGGTPASGRRRRRACARPTVAPMTSPYSRAVCISSVALRRLVCSFYRHRGRRTSTGPCGSYQLHGIEATRVD